MALARGSASKVDARPARGDLVRRRPPAPLGSPGLQVAERPPATAPLASPGLAQRPRPKSFLEAAKAGRPKSFAEAVKGHKAAHSPSSITTSAGDATSGSEEERDGAEEARSTGPQSPVGFTLQSTLLDSTDASALEAGATQATPIACGESPPASSGAGRPKERSSSDALAELPAAQGCHQPRVHNTFVHITEASVSDLLRGCAPSPRPASCPPAPCLFADHHVEGAPNDASASGAFAMLARQCSPRAWEELDAASEPELWHSPAVLEAVAAPVAEGWQQSEQHWAEWEGFAAPHCQEVFEAEHQEVYGPEGFPAEAQEWWPAMDGYAEAGPDSSTNVAWETGCPSESIPWEGCAAEGPVEPSDFWTWTAEPQGSHAESADQAAESAWYWAAEPPARSPTVPPPPPPPPRVPLSLAKAIELEAPDYAPVVPPLEHETVGDAPAVAPRALRDVPGAGAEGSPAATERTAAGRAAVAPRDPRLGTRELPTLGSAGHWQGLCKPCAFLSCCARGAECTSCHLCDADERKRRRKSKMDHQRALRRMDTPRKIDRRGLHVPPPPRPAEEAAKP